MHVYRSFTHKCQNLGATKMFANRLMDKPPVAHLDNKILQEELKKINVKISIPK